MVKLKKGDHIVHQDEIWVISMLNGGNYLANLVWQRVDDGRLFERTEVFNHSKLKHMLVNLGYKVIPKEKASAIKVLYS